MKVIAWIAALLVAMLMVFLTVDRFRATSAPRRAKGIRVGYTKQQVRRILGRPSEITIAGFFDNSETWAYGGHMHWQHLTSYPVRFRLLGPDADEVAIQFDGEEKVTKVIIPKQNGK